MMFKVVWEVWVGNEKSKRDMEFTTEEAALKFKHGLEQMKGMENVQIETRKI